MSADLARPYVIGLDIGTSSGKAVSFELDGRPIRSGRSSYDSLREPSGGVRQRPPDWWSAVLTSLAGAVVPEGDCLGVAVSGQIGTYVAVDSEFRAIEDAWTWQDGGPAAVLDQLRDLLDLPAVSADLRTWLPLGANWPLPRLLWIREQRPDLLERMSYLAMTKDYVIHRLTGAAVTDPSTWRGLMTPEGEVHAGALAALGLPDPVVPRLAATDSAGTILPHVAELVGLPPNVPVFLGSSDYACALLGTGVVDEGDSFDIGGTSEHVGTLSTEQALGSGLCVVPYLPAATPDSYVNYGVTSNGGSVTEWLGSVLLSHREPAEREAELSALAGPPVREKRSLLFLPYLNGERSPLWNADASGAWIGLRAEHDIADLVRAAFEGVAYNLRLIRDGSPLSKPGQQLRATGGTARSQVWNQIKADVLGTPIAVMAELDAAALGAAIHAAVGAGAYPSMPAAIRAMTRISHVVEPRPERTDWYAEPYQRYRDLVDLLESQRPETPTGR